MREMAQVEYGSAAVGAYVRTRCYPQIVRFRIARRFIDTPGTVRSHSRLNAHKPFPYESILHTFLPYERGSLPDGILSLEPLSFEP